jgi:hypothetical protein
MNKMNLLVLATSFTALAGCAHRTRQVDHVVQPTPAQVAQANLTNDRETYVAQTQTRVNEMTKFANDLRARAETAQKPQSKKLQNAADDLDTALKDVEKNLTEVKSAAPENWMDYKRDVTKTMQQAETQYSNSVRLMQ